MRWLIHIVANIIGRICFVYLYICAQHPDNRKNLNLFIIMFILFMLFLAGDYEDG